METILSASNLYDVKDLTDSTFCVCHPAYVGVTVYVYVDVSTKGSQTEGVCSTCHGQITSLYPPPHIPATFSHGPLLGLLCEYIIYTGKIL